MNNLTIKNRDSVIDIAKGLAIILVVVGHVIQVGSENFDSNFGFRIIYSFHMPLFIFLSGAVASFFFDPNRISYSFKKNIHLAISKLIKSAQRLLLPFMVWCVVNQLIYHQGHDVVGALVLAFRKPDTALWFLLAIFYCILLFEIFQILFACVFKLSQMAGPAAKYVEALAGDGRVQIILMILIWWAVRGHTPHGAGLGLLKPYFIYYVLGLGFYRYGRLNISLVLYFLAALIFIILVPWWSRLAPHNFEYTKLAKFVPELILYFYAGIVAICGTMLIVGMARALSNTNLQWIKKSLMIAGQLSLGIYAIHYFFLAYTPKFITPLLLSIAISYLLSKTPYVRTIFLGER